MQRNINLGDIKSYGLHRGSWELNTFPRCNDRRYEGEKRATTLPKSCQEQSARTSLDRIRVLAQSNLATWIYIPQLSYWGLSMVRGGREAGRQSSQEVNVVPNLSLGRQRKAYRLDAQTREDLKHGKSF